MPPVQPSIALESFLENVKAQLAEITVTKSKMSYNDRPDKVREKYTIPSGLNLTISFRLFSFSIIFLTLSTELIMQIGNCKEFQSWRFEHSL